MKTASLGPPALLALLVLLLSVARAPAGIAQQFYHPLRYADVSSAAGFSGYKMAPVHGGGLSAADFDADGDVDVFVPNGVGAPDQLFENLGNGQYQDVAPALGLASTIENNAALWFDHDGDGDLDLLVAGHDPTAASHLSLHQNQSGSFVDVTLAAGLHLFHGARSLGGLAAADINNDGFLDLYVATWDGNNGVNQSRMFQNDGTGAFLDVTASSGVGSATYPAQWQPVFVDLDQDGWQDLYIAVDFHKNLLFMNQGNGTFVDVAPAVGAAARMNDMGATVLDYDQDGDWDLYTTNIYKYPAEMKYNLLLRNDGGLFTDVSIAAGVSDGGWGWGTTSFDADLDGWVDLAATNGWFNSYPKDATKMFLNLQGRGFVDIAKSCRLDDVYWGSGLVAFDHDRDGDLDVMQTTDQNLLRLLECQAPVGHHSLTVRPRMPGPNSHAIGAVVKTFAGGLMNMRLIHCGTSFFSQEPAEALIGLGAASVVDALVVEFPGGSVSTLDDVAADQLLTIFPPPLTRIAARRGVVVGGDGRSLLEADGESLAVQSQAGLTSPFAVVDSVLDLWLEPGSVPAQLLDVEITSHASHGAVRTVLQLLQPASGRLDTWNVHTESLTPSTQVISGIPAGPYMDPLGRVRAQLRSHRVSPAGSPYTLSVDHFEVRAY